MALTLSSQFKKAAQMNFMLVGSYLGILGEKRRVAVPKKILEGLGKNLVLAKWYEDCLILVGDEFWEKLLQRLTGGSKVISLGVRDIERFILGSAFELQPDAQGRIIVPDILAGYAKLGKEIYFLGLGDRVEIWDREIWEKKTGELVLKTKNYIEDIAKDEKS